MKSVVRSLIARTSLEGLKGVVSALLGSAIKVEDGDERCDESPRLGLSIAPPGGTIQGTREPEQASRDRHQTGTADVTRSAVEEVVGGRPAMYPCP